MDFSSGFYDRLQLLTGSIGVVLGIFFGLFLLIRKKGYTKANIFLGIYLLTIGVRITKSLFHNYYAISTAVLNIFLSLFLVIGPSLWLYVRYLASSKNSIDRKDYLHYLPLLAVMAFSVRIPGYKEPYSWIFYFTLFIHGLIYSLYSLYWLWQHKSQKQGEKKVKYWLFALIFSTFLIFINAILIYFEIIPFYPGSSLLFSAILILLSVYGLNNLYLFRQILEKYKNSTLTDSSLSEYLDTLKKVMETEKMFLNPDLTLAKLSEELGLTSKQLSQVINQSESKNYSQYISELRIKESMRLMQSEKHENYKIAAIAYESGFNSISSFNATFKKVTGTTPVKFRKSFHK